MSDLKDYKMSDASKVHVLIEALKTLREAVNDRQPDPGAVAFIDRVLNVVGRV